MPAQNISNYQTAINNLWKQFYSLLKSLQNYDNANFMGQDCKGILELWLHPKGVTNLIKAFTIIIQIEENSSLTIERPNSRQILTNQLDRPQNSNDVKLEVIESVGKNQYKNSFNIEKQIDLEEKQNSANISSQNYQKGKYKRGPYKNYTPQEKQQAVQMLIYQKLSVLQISRRLGIPCKNIKRWSQSGIERKKGGGRKRFSPETQREVARYLLNNYPKGSKLKYQQIQQMAKGTSTDQNFKASRGWVMKFVQRHHLRKQFTFY